MKSINHDDLIAYVENNIGHFHRKRLTRLESLRLDKILKRKNPYLFKAKHVVTSADLIENLLSAYLSSQEETIFGEFLEGLAIFVCQQVYNGQKSAAEGIDLEFEKDGIRYIVSIKSGPNWGNSSQIKRLRDNFRQAKRILKTNVSKMNIVAVNGCCYGRDNNPDKGDYLKLCGQRFWEFISGDSELYTEIIEPLGYRAKEKNEEFGEQYARLINRFVREFSIDFCQPDGMIKWDQLVAINSAVEFSS